MPRRLVMCLASASVLMLTTFGSVYADGVITTGTVSLGVQDFGNLGVTAGPVPSPAELPVGIQIKLRTPFVDPVRKDGSGNPLIFDHMDALFEPELTISGCICEGWGIGFQDPNLINPAVDGFVRMGSVARVLRRLALDSFSLDPGTNTATSIVHSTISPRVQVTQVYKPSASKFLIEDKVTICNTGSDPIGDLLYRRTVDFDAEPTPFGEFMTIQGRGALNLLHEDDGGFVDPNPHDAPVPVFPGSLDNDVVDLGPFDHGADFYFQFGDLNGGDCTSFFVYFGAAPSEFQAINALADVGAESYALAQQSGLDQNDGPGWLSGRPVTWIEGFRDVGGTPVPHVVPEPGIVSAISGLLVASLLAFRRRRD